MVLGPLCIEEGVYYGKTAAIAGTVVAFRSEGCEVYLDFAVTGTKNEELLRVLTGRADKKISLHVCGPDCGALVTDELLVNAHAFEQTG